MSGPQAFIKTRVPACCGTFSTVYRLSFPLRTQMIPQFENAGFRVSRPYSQAGMLYAENLHITITGKLNGTNFELKCKKPNCDNMTTEFETVLTQLYEKK